MSEQGYIVRVPNGTTRTFKLEEVQDALGFANKNGATMENYVAESVAYDQYEAQARSMAFGSNLAGDMTLDLGARAKAYRQATGQSVGSGLISVNAKLEQFLLKGDMVNAIDEIGVVVATGLVDSFVDVYASALLKINDFLEG